MPTAICVVGPINMDLLVRVPRFAGAGETLLGDSFERLPGGKGANQAVAASRLGANVALVGTIGDDEWGSKMRGVLAGAGIDIHGVRTIEGEPTGIGILTVTADGESAAVAVPGANARLSPEDVDQSSKAITSADVLVLQGENPPAVNLRAVTLAKKPEVTVVLHASAEGEVETELLRQVDLLVVTRPKARELLGNGAGEASAAGLARRLASFGPGRVVVTLGSEGAVLFDGQKARTFEGFRVETVDSTSAGDAFVGALAVTVAEKVRHGDALRFACAAGALSTLERGGIPALPSREGVEALVSESRSPATGRSG